MHADLDNGDRSRPEQDPVAEGSGANLGEAKWEAMKDLEPRFPGVTAECVEFEILSEEGDSSRVRAVVNLDTWREVSTSGMPEDPADRLRDLVTRVVQALGIRATVDVSETDEELRATVDGEDLGLLIGKHGATIDALQHIALRAVLHGREDRRRVVVDAAGYRERREGALQRIADKAAEEALSYDRPVELEPMRSLERKVIHQYLSERADVESHSEGDEPDRRLVVSPVRKHDAVS